MNETKVKRRLAALWTRMDGIEEFLVERDEAFEAYTALCADLRWLAEELQRQPHDEIHLLKQVPTRIDSIACGTPVEEYSEYTRNPSHVTCPDCREEIEKCL